jgi:hypothetical protein
MEKTDQDALVRVLGEKTEARIELDRVLIRGHVPERYSAIENYVVALTYIMDRLSGMPGGKALNKGLLAERGTFTRWLDVADSREASELRNGSEILDLDSPSVGEPATCEQAQSPTTSRWRQVQSELLKKHLWRAHFALMRRKYPSFPFRTESDEVEEAPGIH